MGSFLLRLACSAIVLFSVACQYGHAADRTIDGSENNGNRGIANQPMVRFGYRATGFKDFDGAIIDDTVRGNARDISNGLFQQSGSITSARGLSDFVWGWGQFVSHDTDLATESDGPTANGWAPILVTDPQDPLGPSFIPFIRSNWGGFAKSRAPINEVTSFLDGSQVYGSDTSRAAALRTNGGTGAKLRMSANNLLPINTDGLRVENNGPLPDEQLFVAGDIRASENVLLSSMHTIFAREHNRLVDIIAAQQPTLDDEGQYQLARKIVGAEIQAITYGEYLPALLGKGPSVPKAEDYVFSSRQTPGITTAFAQAAARYGHSTVSSQLSLVSNDGHHMGEIAVRDAFYNPGILADLPENLDMLLKGAATQVSQEIDTQVVDELRTFLFGPPGAGGLDLVALNIQRGRDVGLPSYRDLVRQNASVSDFGDITTDQDVAAKLAAVYGDVTRVDAWVGMLAEDHEPGSSVGRLLRRHMEDQYRRLRDGDELFYLGPNAGLYTDGVLNPDIESIVDLDNLKLSDVIRSNSSIDQLNANVFFAFAPGDYNRDGLVTTADRDYWSSHFGTNNLSADGNDNGIVDAADFTVWRDAWMAAVTVVPEPSFSLVAALLCLIRLLSCRSRRPCGVTTLTSP